MEPIPSNSQRLERAFKELSVLQERVRVLVELMDQGAASADLRTEYEITVIELEGALARYLNAYRKCPESRSDQARSEKR
jgi:hypothetical protein